MARTVRNTQTASEVTDSDAVVANAEVKNTIKKVKSTFEIDEAIPCKSVTAGTMRMIGVKSHTDYLWSNEGDVAYVEYQDLVAAVRSGSAYVNKPRFIILNDEFLNEFPNIKKIYDNLYDLDDFETILNLPTTEMKEVINKLPEGIKESLKSVAMNMIAEHRLTDVFKIKALDSIYDTKLMIMLELI